MKHTSCFPVCSAAEIECSDVNESVDLIRVLCKGCVRRADRERDRVAEGESLMQEDVSMNQKASQ